MAAKVVLGVDVGTTNIRCYAYNELAEVIGGAKEKVPVLEYEDGRHEIEPEVLWSVFQNVIRMCLTNCHLQAKDILGMGISTQRASFLTWNRITGEPFHNFITWKDRRAESYCNDWNSSLFFKTIRFGASLMYFITRRKLFQVASVLKFKTSMVLPRLYWIVEQNIKVKEHISKKQLLFGTIDTWLVWKLTGGEIHATDSSNACVTGFFDMFKMQWLSIFLKYFDIPEEILPEVKNTSDYFGKSLPQIFGSSIPITALVGDQQASLFGSNCFENNEVNCTMGTGSFLNMNTGFLPEISINEIYPLVAWTICNQTTYMVESCVHNVGNILTLAQNIGCFNDPGISSTIAQTAPASDVFFLPTATLLEISPNNSTTDSAIIGLKVETTKEQIVQSILEALSFQVFLLSEHMEIYGAQKAETFRICGGVSKNDFILQLISDLLNKPVIRMLNCETSSLGAAFLAGLHCGVWKNIDEIVSLNREFQTFNPNSSSTVNLYLQYKKWKNALYTVLNT